MSNMKKGSYFLSAMLIALVAIALIILTTRSGAISLFSPADLTPTAIPPAILTQLAQDSANQSATQTAYPPIATQFIQTEQALQLTIAVAPTLDLQEIYPIFSNEPPSADDILSGKADYPLAGYGILYEDQEWGDSKYDFSGLIWEELTYDSSIVVRSGRVRGSPTQGAIRVIIAPHDLHSTYQNDVVIESPAQAGALTITGAVGERLILTSEQGQTFYFDVPALRFVDSLEESVPSVTPPPTVEFPPEFTDDAPDEPRFVSDYPAQLEEKDRDYYINSPGDYDWFHFVSQAEGTLKVSLIPRGKNYGLRVILGDQDGEGIIVEEDITSGGGVKQVIVSNAPSGNYIVRVWSLDGSYDERRPYTLRFKPPKPEKVVPILECVAENPDGTFTAHYGYENPNPYVVVIDSRHQNTFHPGPVFRTGQPEYFAPGRVEDYFAVLFDGNGLTWVLDGHAVTANRNSPRCP
ncbi:MAG: hypothetical protein ABIQ77_10015 [Anaerolineales bacterium]